MAYCKLWPLPPFELNESIKPPSGDVVFFFPGSPLPKSNKINDFEITGLHMLHPRGPSNPEKKRFKIIFLWCTNVWQQEHFLCHVVEGG